MYHILAEKQNCLRAVFRLLVAFILLVVFTQCMVWPQVAFAKTPPSLSVSSSRLTVEIVQKSIDQIEESKEIDDGTKASILALYREAMQDVVRAEIWMEKSRVFKQDKKSAAKDIEKAKAALSEDSQVTPIDIPINASLRRLERLLAEAEAVLIVAEEKLTAAEIEPRRRAIRRLEVEQLLKEARRRAIALERQREALLSANKPIGPLELARQVRLQAALETAQMEIEGYTKELAAQGATTDLLPLMHDLAAREAALAKAAVEDIKKRASDARRKETEEQIREAATQKATLADPSLRDLANVNEKLARERQDLIEKTKQSEEALGRSCKKLARIEKEFEGLKDKLKSVGRKTIIALYLKALRLKLLEVHEYLESIEDHQPETLETLLS